MKTENKKAIELFEKWLREKFEFENFECTENLEGISFSLKDLIDLDFYLLPFEMQWGVWLKFFRSNDIWIEPISETPQSHFIKFLAPDIISPFYELPEEICIDGEPEQAQKAAIEKALTILNDRL